MGDWTNDHIQLINVITTHMFGSGHRDFECPVLHLPNCAANPADRIPLSLIRAVKKHLVHHGLYNEQNHQASKLKSIFHQMYLYARWIYTYIYLRISSLSGSLSRSISGSFPRLSSSPVLPVQLSSSFQQQIALFLYNQLNDSGPRCWINRKEGV